ncbi:MAG: MFS transporter [Candidatus Binataceae bacterium]
MNEQGEMGGADTGEGAPRSSLLGYGRSFWLLFWATFALNSASNLFVLYPLQLVQFGASAGVIGAVIGTWSLASLASRPAASPLIERLGRRSTAMWLLCADVLIVALYLPIGAIGWHVYAVRALHGAIEGTARVALFAMVFGLLPEGREGEAMSVFSTCGMGSAALAPIVAELLIRNLGFGAFFLAAIALTAIAAYFARMVPDDKAPPAAAEVPAAASSAGTLGYGALLLDAGLLPLWIVTLMFALAISCRLSFVAPFATERGIVGVAWYFTIYSLVAIAIRLGGARFMDRIGMERALLPSMIILAAGVALIAGTGHYRMLYIAAALGGLGHAYVYPALSAMVIGRTRADAIGRSSSIYQSLYDLGAMAGPYSLGAVAMFFGYGPMFVVSGALALAGGAYFAAVEPVSRTRRLA